MDILREILFVVLVFSPFAIAVPLAIDCRRRGANGRIVRGLLIGTATLCLWALLQPLTIGITYWHFALISALAMTVFGMVSSAFPRRQQIFGFLSILLCGLLAYLALFQISDGYRDNRRVQAYYARRENLRRQLHAALAESAANQSFPAGYFFLDSPLLSSLPVAKRKETLAQLSQWGYAWTTSWRWHTPLTGLYRVDRTPMRLWYAGGTVEDHTLMKLEWRPAPTVQPTE